MCRLVTVPTKGPVVRRRGPARHRRARPASLAVPAPPSARRAARARGPGRHRGPAVEAALVRGVRRARPRPTSISTLSTRPACRCGSSRLLRPRSKRQPTCQTRRRLRLSRAPFPLALLPLALLLLALLLLARRRPGLPQHRPVLSSRTPSICSPRQPRPPALARRHRPVRRAPPRLPTTRSPGHWRPRSRSPRPSSHPLSGLRRAATSSIVCLPLPPRCRSSVCPAFSTT